MKIELMDTTLRDGEQTSGVSFKPSEKLNIAQLLLEEVKVDRIEVASARVSEGEFEGVKQIIDWAKQNNCIHKIEVLGFLDGTISIDWICKSGAKVLNLLTKGSLKHLQGQLKKTPQEHVEAIKNSIAYATAQNVEVNIYLEDWSNGMRNSQEYILFLLDSLKDENIKRFMLPDTLGILNPEETFMYCKLMVDRYPNFHFDFHSHNDYDLAVANVFSAVKAGIKGIHTTVNGLGERAGNSPLSSVIAVLKDHLKKEVSVDETKIYTLSHLVERFSGLRIPNNKPIIGDNVFTQTSGVHADGDSKDNLYYNELLPERFGRLREYALGKTSGKANILKNLQELGIKLSAEDIRKVTHRVIELGDQKSSVTKEDLPYIIADVLDRTVEERIKLEDYSSNCSSGMKSSAMINIKINGKKYQEIAMGDGQYDAFFNALKKVYSAIEKQIPSLVDYVVAIPPGGKPSALVETTITWDNRGKYLITKGLDSDQLRSAIKATIKMLNIVEMRQIVQ